MTMVKDFRGYAEECRMLAQRPGNDSAQLLKIAGMWDDLAHEQDRRLASCEPSRLQRAATWVFHSRAVRG